MQHTTTEGADAPRASAPGRLTDRQAQLIEIIRRKNRHGLPAVQRDLAEELGIRRDSLNKLLARARRVLAAEGIELQMPARCRPAGVGAGVCSLADLTLA